MNRFELDDCYFTTVTNLIELPSRGITDEERVIRKLKGRTSYMYETRNHAEFEALRVRLDRLGFIRIQRTYHNGDLVLHGFYLNGAEFRPGETFYSPTALKHTIQTKLSKGTKWQKTQ